MSFKTLIKKSIFYVVGGCLELPLLSLLALAAIVSRASINRVKDSVFMGMMHINNWTYVAKALRGQGYQVKVVPWMIPAHEEGVIPYDVNLKAQYPALYKSFYGQYILQYGVFLWSLFTFQFYITPFRSRILDRTVWLKVFEIPLLHLAGKKVLLNTYGGDVATPRLKRRHDLKYSLYDGYTKDPQYLKFNEKAISRNTRLLERQADCVISAIDHIDYLDRVDHYFHLRCIDTDNIEPNFNVINNPPVFIHAPNHRLVKGTDKIIEVIDTLNKQGFACELKIVENTPNDQLLDMIKASDGVIDQLLLGTYARLAIEAMALGKPVFCYLRDDLYEFNKNWVHCPIINVDPDNLEAQLKSFLQLSASEKINLGQKSREYVEHFHSLESVGSRCSAILKEVAVG